MKIGPKLKSLRESKKLSYYKLAQESDIPADYLKRIEESTEENDPNISIDVLERLCNALSIPVSDFLNENEQITFLTPKENELINIFRRFCDKEQEACITFMDLVSNRPS